MATIGSLNINLGANIANFTAGLNKSVGELNGWAGKVASFGAGFGVSFDVGGAVASLKSVVSASMENIDAVAKLADRTGVATEALTGLQYAADLAGVSSETLTGGLEKMLNNLAEAVTKGNDAGKALATMGLDARTLANGSTIDSFKQIADGLAAIQNPAQRAAAAVDVFGKSGQQMLPLLMSGSAGIQEMATRAELLAQTFSRTDAATVEAANDALTDVGKVVTGIGNKLAIELSPFIKFAADQITDFAISGQGLGPKVGGALDAVGKSLAYSLDLVNLVKAGFKEFVAVGAIGLAKIIEGIDFVIDGLTMMLNKIPGVSVSYDHELAKVAESFTSFAGKMHDDAAKAFKAFENRSLSGSVIKFFSDLKTKARAAAEGFANAKGVQAIAEAQKSMADKIEKTVAGLQQQERELSMGADAAKRFQLQIEGATQQQLAQVQAVQEHITALREQKKATEDAARARKQEADDYARNIAKFIDDTRSPLEKFQAEVMKVQDLVAHGLDPSIASRGLDTMLKNFTSETARSTELPRGPEAKPVRFIGTPPAFRRMENADATAAKQTAQNTQRMLATLTGIETALRAGGAAVGLPLGGRR